MKRSKIFVMVLTVLFLAAAVFFGARETDAGAAFSFLAVTEAGSQEIRFWQDEHGDAFVFLPGYVNLSQLQLVTRGTVAFDDLALNHGLSCEKLELGRAYGLSGKKDLPGSITFLQSKNLPAMFITTESGSMEQVNESKDNEEAGALRLYDADGTLDFTGSVDSLSIHGNGMPDKLPYNLKLSAPGDLLGMGAAKKWILLSNYGDPSHIRNDLVFDFAAAFGLPYTPESRWVDLYLNGAYAGLYQLTERNEIGESRVDLPGGSLLVSSELKWRLDEAEKPYILTRGQAALQIRGGDLSPEEGLKAFQSAENAILAADGRDPETGKHFSELIDLGSWVKKYLIEECFGNVDGGGVSQFFYLNGADGKIYAGPVWDYDMAMGNGAAYRDPAPNMLYVDVPQEDGGSLWMHRLCQDPEFSDQVKRVYQEEFLPLLNKILEDDHSLAEIEAAAALNGLRWGEPAARDQAELVKNYLREHNRFLTELWTENEPRIRVRAITRKRLATYILTPGSCLPALPDYEGSWYLAGTDTPLDLTAPIFESMTIEQRVDTDE